MSLQDVRRYMRPEDVRAFVDAAKFYRVFILLRRSNEASLAYIGKVNYTPKRLDCKAKTADMDVTVPNLGRKQTAGLVVNPTLPGFAGAFKSSKKAQDAQDTWRQFEPLCYLPEPGRNITYFPGGKLYSVQMDQAHKHYGCVMFSSNSLHAAGKYVHGDYDIFSFVQADESASNGVNGSAVNVRVAETRLGQPHSRSRVFFDVQHYLNRKMGVAMVLHGEQETYSNHTDEALDVFWPDGREPSALLNKAEIESFYASVFQGRETFHKGVKGPVGIFHNR